MTWTHRSLETVRCVGLALAVSVGPPGCGAALRVPRAALPPQRSAGPPAAPSEAPRADAPTTRAPEHFGQPFAPSNPLPLRELAQTPRLYAGRSIQTAGVVVRVCPISGCWIDVRDGATQVHVRMHGHAFFVPRNAAGRRVLIEGVVVPTIPAHRDAARPDETDDALFIDATGVALP